MKKVITIASCILFLSSCACDCLHVPAAANGTANDMEICKTEWLEQNPGQKWENYHDKAKLLGATCK